MKPLDWESQIWDTHLICKTGCWTAFIGLGSKRLEPRSFQMGAYSLRRGMLKICLRKHLARILSDLWCSQMFKMSIFLCSFRIYWCVYLEACSIQRIHGLALFPVRALFGFEYSLGSNTLWVNRPEWSTRCLESTEHWSVFSSIASANNGGLIWVVSKTHTV